MYCILGEVGLSKEALIKQVNPSPEIDRALSKAFGKVITLDEVGYNNFLLPGSECRNCDTNVKQNPIGLKTFDCGRHLGYYSTV